MKKSIKYGVVAGLVFGIIDIIPMFFMENFVDKNSALISAFINRFAIGFFIFTSDFSVKGWLKGAVIGLLLSLPDALITKAYVPIIGTGIFGGVIIGMFEHRMNNK